MGLTCSLQVESCKYTHTPLSRKTCNFIHASMDTQECTSVCDDSHPFDGGLFSQHLSKYRPVYLMYPEDADCVILTHKIANAKWKSISLLLPRYAKLISLRREIDEAISKSKTSSDYKFSKHLGGLVYVTVSSKYPCVDIRQFYMYDGDLKPRRQGVALHYAEWYYFKQAYQPLCKVLPQLTEMKHCSAMHDIENLDETLACEECYPY